MCKHSEAGGLWAFKNNDGSNGTEKDVPIVVTYSTENYRLPKKDPAGSSERDEQINKITTDVLKKRVGHKLVRRLAYTYVPPGSPPGAPSVVGNAADTGYDIEIDSP